MMGTSRAGDAGGRHVPAGGTPCWWARARATAYDLVPIWSWFAGLGVVFGLLRLCRVDAFTPLFTRRASADVMVFAVTVLPVGVLFSAAEAGRSSASWGKRRVGLVVTDLAGGPPTWGRAVRRNAVKFAAWQCAHFGLLRVTGAVSHRRAHLLGSALLWGSYVLAAADVVPALRRSDARALHDLAAGTRAGARC